jgi:hypothetical protein
MTSEADIEDYLHTRVKERGGEYRRTSWIGRSNAPDDRIMLPGNCFWAECKAPDVVMSDTARGRAQLREHARMRALGERVEVIASFEDVDRLIP